VPPARKRKIRLVVALSAAVLLACALVYTSLLSSSESVSPSDLVAAKAGADTSYTLTGKVVDNSVRNTSSGVDFRVRDREGTTSVPVSYSGAVPDPFREGREVIVTVRKQGDTFVGERDSLVTKCPSKFTEDATQRSS
jgi:cytochrome c-type biogenesis protein CcmE